MSYSRGRQGNSSEFFKQYRRESCAAMLRGVSRAILILALFSPVVIYASESGKSSGSAQFAAANWQDSSYQPDVTVSDQSSKHWLLLGNHSEDSCYLPVDIYGLDPDHAQQSILFPAGRADDEDLFTAEQSEKNHNQAAEPDRASLLTRYERPRPPSVEYLGFHPLRIYLISSALLI